MWCGALTKILCAVADLSSLDVQSFSGTLTAKTQNKNDGSVSTENWMNAKRACLLNHFNN